MLHEELPANNVGRDFFVGDIHGRFDLLELAMKIADFDPVTDRIIAVGDLVDRGQYSHRVLDWLQRPYFHSVRGNHEDMWLLFMEDDKLANKRGFVDTFKWFFELSEAERSEFKRLVEQLPYAITIGDIGVCHANTPRGKTWQHMVDTLSDSGVVETVTWDYVEDYQDERPVAGIQYVIHGHTIFDKPTRIGQHLYIDTGAFYSGRLTFSTLPELIRLTTAQ